MLPRQNLRILHFLPRQAPRVWQEGCDHRRRRRVFALQQLPKPVLAAFLSQKISTAFASLALQLAVIKAGSAPTARVRERPIHTRSNASRRSRSTGLAI